MILRSSTDGSCYEFTQYEDGVCTDNTCKSGKHTLENGSECDYWGTIDQATRTCTDGGYVTTTSCGGSGSDGGTDPSTGGTGGSGGSTGGDPADSEPDSLDPDSNPVLTKPLERSCIAGYTKDENGSCVIDDEYQIINELEGKALCVYNKLKSTSTGFKNAIKKFEPDFPVAHLKFEIDYTMSSNTKKGYTRPPENYVIDIVLNGNAIKDASFQKRPNLLVAKTIIHEIIHAEMWRKLLSLASDNGDIDINKLDQMLLEGDYPGMLDYYLRYGRNINSNWQHQQMAAHYRETIARALQEFDTGTPVPSDQQPSQFYKDLAWEGLIYSDITAWQQVMNAEEDNRIESVISNYIGIKQNESCVE
ncbi:hypothetical protein [Christiangramia sabulilitoris]|uniref:Uncharacterized protein n=1 Tax=Christiangramia sabulilitoris TaxID=2583991 RepID=A0A550I757_9FLAO|nr:hypothetical protein [Christiangramia sabulilitoris]TRO66791.1 hypothetical protein FGM01_02555 [Christiangramia sabulilitoris]